MMEMTRTDPEWKDKIITGDETWVYGYDPETKPQSAEWRDKDSQFNVEMLLIETCLGRCQDGQGVIIQAMYEDPALQGDMENLEKKAVFLTVHDIGSNHSSFHEFVDHPSMVEIKQRSIFLHVDVPGQEDNAGDLSNDRPAILAALSMADINPEEDIHTAPQLAGCTDRSDLLHGQDTTTTTSVGRYCDQGAWTDLICSMEKTPPPPQLAGIVIRVHGPI
ncbi:hypothetical protein LAZ67_2004037 [Cordylochernes scorpioides]|uniref:Uncharacterized protein n=1 Tax=Cordylochernes scorpioides TaxID=51811 RepID=A0ABY6K4C9_9ARAC|nr:hypothetical protein LAZ67_2004037 [Cordylochernes scorpioides]